MVCSVRTVFEGILDGRESGDDTLLGAPKSARLCKKNRAMSETYSGVRDLAILHGDIEVDTDEDTLALEVKICDSELVGEGHGVDGRGWLLEEREGPIDVDADGI